MLLSIKKNEWVGNPRENIFAGLVSSVAILPEVIGFAIIAGVHPMSALFASAITLLVITLTGGRPAMVSAAAGSMALVIAGVAWAKLYDCCYHINRYISIYFRLFEYS